ncbi:hypothetical protein L2E82_28666 [Cichorium intybus]|uniref:Uncharacterized protein n=1 Tax=Cichorium intybus TaxID=13427 RepID=A0ACB9CWK4_CICIN|nr:hypothetical protein L2E82_28666 [Cichorium intybus]
MAERNTGSSSSIGFLSMKSLLGLLSVALMVFMLSWFLLLTSDGRSRLIDHNRFPQSKQHSTLDNHDHIPSSPTHNARSIDYQRPATLKVFMYDLPPEFHFEILHWEPEGNTVWPDINSIIPVYPGGLNLQHSVAYWLTLDLLASSGQTAIRVHNSSEADVIFVPFFSSICFNRFSRLNPHQKTNRNKELQRKLVKYLTGQPEWKRSGGIDHIIVAHHPNSLLDARYQLWPAMFILSDFGRYPPTIANINKDLIAPYKHIIKSYTNDSSTFDSRPILLFFQGAIYRKDGGFIRQEIFYLLQNEKDVHFTFGSVHKQGVPSATKGMRSSKFCLNIAGDTPSSNRLFDAIVSHCVPVIISDKIELPFEDVLDYSEFCVFVKTSDAIKEGFLINFIRSIGRDEWTRKWKKLQEVKHYFDYRYPSVNGDAVQMIWRSVLKKVPVIKRRLHAANRFSRFQKPGRKLFPLPRNFTY